MIINIAMIVLLLYMCIGITFVIPLIMKQSTGSKRINKKNIVTVIGEEFETQKPVSSRVIPLTDEYEHDQATKFKNLSNR